MVTYDDSIQNCKDLANDSSSTAQTFFIRFLNYGYKYILSELGRPVIEKTLNSVTRAPSSPLVTSDRAYQMPPDFQYLKSVTITIGNQAYPVVEEESQEMFDYRQRVLMTGIPSLYFVRPRFGIAGAEILFDPIPAAASYPLTLVYEATDKDLSQTVVNSGANLTFTYNSATITASAGVFTIGMVGRYIKTTDPQGDGFYYRIIQYNSATSITIENVYQGTNTFTTGTWEIHEIWNLPEEMQVLPHQFALASWYDLKKDSTSSAKFMNYFTTGLEQGKERWATKTRSNVVRSKHYMNRWRVYPAYFPYGGIIS